LWRGGVRWGSFGFAQDRLFDYALRAPLRMTANLFVAGDILEIGYEEEF
jgi:hypothetical protein